MGDRVAVMRKGELQQVAPPQELYDRPANIFVAGFIGSPAMNMLEAQVERGRDGDRRRPRRRAARGRRSPRSRSYVGQKRRRRHPPGGPRGRGACERRLRAVASAVGSSCARRSARRCSSTSRSPRARPSTEDMRELAEDVGDDRVVEQLASDGQQVATLVGRFGPRTTATPATRSRSRSTCTRSTSSIWRRGSRSASARRQRAPARLRAGAPPPSARPTDPARSTRGTATHFARPAPPTARRDRR